MHFSLNWIKNNFLFFKQEHDINATELPRIPNFSYTLTIFCDQFPRLSFLITKCVFWWLLSKKTNYQISFLIIVLPLNRIFLGFTFADEWSCTNFINFILAGAYGSHCTVFIQVIILNLDDAQRHTLLSQTKAFCHQMEELIIVKNNFVHGIN